MREGVQLHRLRLVHGAAEGLEQAVPADHLVIGQRGTLPDQHHERDRTLPGPQPKFLANQRRSIADTRLPLTGLRMDLLRKF